MKNGVGLLTLDIMIKNTEGKKSLSVLPGWSDITQLVVLPSIEGSQAAAMLYSCFGCNYYIGRVVSDVYCFAFRDTVSVRFVGCFLK